MRPTSDLARLEKSTKRRIQYLRGVLKAAAQADARTRNAAAAFSVIELDNLIINLHREFLVSALYLRGVTCGGRRITHTASISNQIDAGLFIMSILEPGKYKKKYAGATSLARRDETKIRNPLKLQQVSSACMLSNTVSIVNALSLNSQLFSQIADFRNFFAHRNEETALLLTAKSQQIGIPAVESEWQTIPHLLPNKPYSLFESWATDLDLFISFLLD